jgi:competence protein ComEA
MLAGIAPHLMLAPAPMALIRASQPSPKPAAAGAIIDLNSATAAELDALPGIGPALAERVVAHRERYGRFRSVDELEKVPGIGPSLVARVRGRATATP